jgi:hypothetical protein
MYHVILQYTIHSLSGIHAHVQYAYKEEICISKHNTHKSNTNLKENAALAVSKLMKEFEKHIGRDLHQCCRSTYFDQLMPNPIWLFTSIKIWIHLLFKVM